MDIEVTLLSKKDIKENEIIKKIGPACDYHYWTSTSSLFIDWGSAGEFYVAASGELGGWNNVASGFGVRPVIKTDNLNELIKNSQIKIENGIEIIEYGAYPNLFEEVDINKNVLQETGKTYTMRIRRLNKFKLIKCKEYEYNGEKLIEYYGTYYKVKQIEFYIDRKNNMLISKDLLFPSPINVDNQNYNGNFETSQLYQFLNNEFIKELNPNIEKQHIDSVESHLKTAILSILDYMQNIENDETLEITISVKKGGKQYAKKRFHTR